MTNQIHIRMTGSELTPAIKSSIEDKLSVITDFLSEEDQIFTEITVEQHASDGKKLKLEIRITPKGIVAETRGTDFYEALDLCIPKVKEQLIKSKEKRLTIRKRLGAWFRN